MHRLRALNSVLFFLLLCHGFVFSASFRFTVTSDSRSQRANFQHVLAEVNRLLGDEGAFHISPGDIDPPQDNYDDLLAAFGADVVWYPVVGNHEAETADDMTWIRNHFSSLPYIVNSGPAGCENTTYSFDYENAHFVVINEYYDGTSDTGTDGNVVDALYNWLEADLNATTKDAVFVFGHEPAFPFCRHVGDSLDQYPAERDRFWNLLESKKVLAYFCAHTHFYSRYREGGGFVRQIDTGNAGNEAASTECGSTDGGTFLDVQVTDAEVTFSVYRGSFPEGAFDLSESWSVPLEPVPPTANDDSYETFSDTTLDVAAPGVLENDSDPNGDPLTAILLEGPTHGTLTLNPDGSFTYDPEAGYTGSDSFSYKANDGTFDSNSATVAIDVKPPEATYTFSQGVNGYSGTVDTLISENAPDSSYPTATSLTVDSDDPPGSGNATQVLLRFENIIGDGPNQIPPGSSVLSATLTLETTDPGDGASLHRMLQTWSDTDTWNGYGNGIQADDTEARSAADLTTGSVAVGSTVLDVTESVQAWVNGEENHGWVLLPVGTNGWDFQSAEGTNPPTLTVKCPGIAPPAPPTGLTAAAAGEEVALDWDDNTEPSLSGYNVYRSTASGGPYDLINGDGASALGSLTSAAGTGEKPQSKLWFHRGIWWCVLPDASGTYLWRLDHTTWTKVLELSTSAAVHADCKPAGDVTHILLFAGTASRLVSVEYVPGSPPTYQLWSVRPEAADVTLSSGVETASCDIDSTGRMWIASDAVTDIEVRYSDYPYSSWSGPVILESGVSSDDICAVTALPDGRIGVLWSNQAASRFGFKTHTDGDDPAVWSADEVPASDDSVGAGVADDHINLAVASDGTLYAAVKTSYDTAGHPKIALLVRRPDGTWDPLYEVDQAGTRPIVVVNETLGFLRVIYTESEGYHSIVYKETALNSIAFGTRELLIQGALNSATSTKQNFEREIVVLAGSDSSVEGIRITWNTNADPLQSSYTDRDVAPGGTYYYVVTAVDNIGQESGFSNEATATPLPPAPQAPTELTAQAVSSNQIDLTWKDNAGNEEGFSIERSPDQSAWTEIATVGMNSTTYSDTGLLPLTTYYYRVRAYNAGGYSDYSNEAGATTPQGNHAPTADDQSVVTDEDTPVDITLTASDEDGDPLTYTIATYPAHGALTGTPPDVTYTPDPDWWGSDQFTFFANDGQADSNTATVSIEVVAVNDPPAAPTNLTASGGTDLITLDWDDNVESEGDLQGYRVFRSTTSGSYDFTSPLATVTESSYTDSAVQEGVTYYYVVRAFDTGGLESESSNEASAATAVPEYEAYATTDPLVTYGTLGGDGIAGTTAAGDGLVQTISESPNGPKGRASLQAEYTLDSPADPSLVQGLTLYLQAVWTENDADDPLRIFIWNGSEWLDITAEISSGSYSPADNASSYVNAQGDVRVLFTDTARIDKESKDTLTIDLLYARIVEDSSSNNPPSAVDDSAQTDEDVPVDVFVLSNDTDPDGDPLTVSAVTQGSHGSVVNHDSYVTYTPDPDFAGTDTFSYTVSDGNGRSSTATVTVTVNPVQDPPFAEDDAATTNVNTAVDIQVLSNDGDVDGDTLTVASVTQPGNGSVQNNGTYVTYTPDTDFTGTDTFSYTVSDGNGGTASATVTVTVSQALLLYVHDIQMGSKTLGVNYVGTATVWVKDAGGADIEGATVYGTWSGDVSGTVNGVTGADGKVLLESPKKKGGGTFVFTVTDIVKDGYTYEPTMNNETSDSVTAP